MKITFLGAARGVTGSMHLLEVNGQRILLECGLFQGHRQEAAERNRNLPFDAKTIDVLVLSHAHIDHSGNIPQLVRSGFQGSIYATFATRDLCSIMLTDAAHIMESDAAYLNKKRNHRGQDPIEPLYTIADATHSLQHFVAIAYERPIQLTPEVRLTLFDAGHILGSALCALDITEDQRRYRLLFTGDLGRTGLPILCDPQTVPDVDYLITESTYGNRLHGRVQDAEEQLAHVVQETHAQGGRVIIPAFSVGRTQEIVYALHRLHNVGAIPRLPIYVDSPLSTNATDIFRLHPEAYDAETYEMMRRYRDPFGFGQLHYIRDVEESKALNNRNEPMVIISASGMCESGRILHHLKNNIENPRNTILFVGFQAENTLGRRILDGEKEVPIFGERYPVKARVKRIDGYSAHADRQELLDYIQKLGIEQLKRILIVHGDEENTAGLHEGLKAAGAGDVQIPAPGEQVTL